MKARTQTSYLFDLDGTLVDSVYDHVMAWTHALHETESGGVAVAHPPAYWHVGRFVLKGLAAGTGHRN